MSDTEKTAGERPELDQPSGIFEPRSFDLKKKPLSGKQISIRIIAAALIVIGGLLAYFWLSSADQRPVKRYYKAYSAEDPAAMAEAFPDWLREANTAEGEMDVTAMCAAMISVKKLNYGENAKVKMGVIGESHVEEARLDQLERGIKTRYGKDVTVSDGLNLTLAVTYIKPDGSEVKNMEYATVYRIDRHWYMLDVATDQAPS